MSIVRNLVNVSLVFFRCLLLMVVMIIVTSNIFGKVRVETINGLRYRLNSTTKTATVISFNGRLNKDSLNVPRKVKASDHCLYLVTSLGNSCFSGCSSLISITVPSDVLIDTSRGVETIFEDCQKLEKVIFKGVLSSDSDTNF